MRTLKAIAVLMVTVALFFSCEWAGPEAYGTLLINPSGSSVRTVTGKINEESDNDLIALKNDISYRFECINEKAGTIITTKEYPLEVPQDVVIQLVPGDWAVWVKVLQKVNGLGGDLGTGVIGSTQYNNGKPVTIRAGQAIILGGTDVKVSPYGMGRASFFNRTDDIDDIKEEEWNNGYPININRYISRISANTDPGQPSSGYTLTTTPPYDPAPYGTANILWDNDYLYVRVIVEGARLFDQASEKYTVHEFNSNSVEIFYTKDGGTGYQYRITNAGVMSYYTTGSRSNSRPANLLGFASIPIDDTSYAVIARIEHGVDTSQQSKIGVDLQINGIGEINGYRSSIAVWYDGQVYNTPEAYATSITLGN